MKARGSIVQVTAERPVNAPAAHVYRLIADYRDHHPAFLPTAFSDLVVEQGGIGAGTEISFSMRLGGRSRRVRARVTEPVPGRVPSETDADRGAVTSFHVTDDGDRSRVKIETEFVPAPGVQGWFERLIAPGMLCKLFNEEFENLDRYASDQAA